MPFPLSASTPPSSHPLGASAALQQPPLSSVAANPHITPAHRASLGALAEAALGGRLAPGAADALVDLLAAGAAPGSVTAVLGAVCRSSRARLPPQ